MSPIIALSMWTALLSLTITYAWWVRLRVWFLRQDLFNIRDVLWQQMHDSGSLGDQSYLEFRDGINSIIRIVPYLSFIVLARILFEDGGTQHSSGKELVEVVNARKLVVDRLLRYMLQESVVGLAALAIVFVYQCKSLAEIQVAKWISRLIDSSSVRALRLTDECSIA